MASKSNLGALLEKHETDTALLWRRLRDAGVVRRDVLDEDLDAALAGARGPAVGTAERAAGSMKPFLTEEGALWAYTSAH
jgi:hypothetical protein